MSDYQSGYGMAELDGKKNARKVEVPQPPAVPPKSPSAIPSWTWLAIVGVGGVLGLAYLGFSYFKKRKREGK